MNVIANGAAVTVRHKTGITEPGVVRGRTNPAMPDDRRFGLYDIEFAAGVRCSVPAHTVTPAHGSAAR